MATIAAVVMLAVLIAAGVTFVSVQKKDSAFWATYSQNMFALAKGEGGTGATHSCYFNLSSGSIYQHECDARTDKTPWYKTPGEPQYPCSNLISARIPGPFDDWGSCFTQ